MILCNKRFAHGRPPYNLQPGESRTLGVILGNRFKRIGQKKFFVTWKSQIKKFIEN